LRAGLVYNDANDYNILVSDGRVTSLIDYGDIARNPLVCDLAIGIAYAVMAKPDPLSAAAQVVAGYHEALALTEAELAVLYALVCARLCVSVTNAAVQRHAEPENEYLLISERPAWALLEKLDAINPDFAHYTFRAACGLPACPASPAIVDWLTRHPGECGPVVAAKLGTESVVFDLSAGSTEFGTLADMRDAGGLSRQLFNRIGDAGARAGIGRYDEARLIYTGDLFATTGNDGPERRTVHLGLDVFMAAGSAVLAPLDGVVTSAVDNAGPLDYGPTIILEHAPAGGPRFYTLYGHLSRESLRNLRAGQAVTRGQRIGTLGDASVNGGWPPHLHFQIIADLVGRTGEFPGVAPASQRAVWLSLSPDPNLVAHVPAAKFPPATEDAANILTTRRDRLGRSLSLAYQKPLHIVRGYGQHLYDADGRAYLDAVNNVAHVGHCHPRVVRAGQVQMAVLNTNSRYLHEHIVRYAERLCATLPDPLRVCFFVNSGSEACELALRLARTHTRSDATVVLEGAYHGNSAALVDISPYKYDGPGGAGRPPFVRHIPMPDPYRGRYRGADAGAGAKYAAEVQRAVENLRAADRPKPTFIAESLMGSSGQIVFPDGFLRAAYRHVHAAGGVCIADEVQVGFGRVGTHFWGFETQGVVPDIVVMGKPIGNGHPLGAVVTTPVIAGSFHNGMEYFSTFGGNPVSCATGLAVLDVIRDEGLQARARRVGERLRHGFRALATRHPLIGDVRGAGLFLGVEFVRDRATLEPASGQTAYVSRRLKDRGILVSVDGPLHNVLKIKPPLVFDDADADVFVETLDLILTEDAAQP
jgi:4-aminobutyrate aminotransferase-like enzyme